ncbi:glycosyltransferase family 2 protein [Pantoea vagans]|uniref:glycosyltransferase family 2 protein n=1 Tax=Pantoea vagans TaxID=470934 RepID=UPI002255E98C|nr:glycosyltransferase family 2 protein [Pantoea vagans]MCX3309103.1 glycosyltransferase family 2 protein [Pantoea vagans]
MQKKTLAIIVTYYPQPEQLTAQLDILSHSDIDIVIVDNASDNNQLIKNMIEEHYSHIKLILCDSNLGIAAAHNIGINHAINNSYSYVLLMDQDSLPAINMIPVLQEAMNKCPKAAAVGPQFLDANNNVRSRFIQIRGLMVDKNLQPDINGCVIVDHLISSGSLIAVENFKAIGLMEEELFIDYVDVEWALRARSKGFINYGVCNAHMIHSLGDDRVDFLNNSIAIHSPLRHYYQARNALLLYKRNYIPLNWKVVDAFKLLVKMFIYIIASRHKSLELKMIFRGVMHGLRGIHGRFTQ